MLSTKIPVESIVAPYICCTALSATDAVFGGPSDQLREKKFSENILPGVDFFVEYLFLYVKIFLDIFFLNVLPIWPTVERPNFFFFFF